MSGRAYINTTCKVGQSEPCGEDAVWSIAVTEVTDTAWASEGRPGGVVALCRFHAEIAVAKWDALAPDECDFGPGCNAPDCTKKPGHMGAHR